MMQSDLAYLSHRECLGDIIVLNERHLCRVLRSYADYYHQWRTHRSLEMDAPEPRPVQPPVLGPVRKLPEVGGLHHHYERLTARQLDILKPIFPRVYWHRQPGSAP
jgi:hypothetical protein